MSAVTASQIAELLGDMPLALAQAAAYLDYSAMPHHQYLELLTNKLDELISLGDLTDRPGVAISTLWTLSLRNLEATRPDAVGLLQMCAFLAPEPIPLDLFLKHPEHLPEPLSATALSPIAWEEVVGGIVGRSLARRDGDKLIVHRLVQSAIRHSMSEEMRTAVCAAVARLLLADAPGDVRDHPTRWRRWQELLPHALAAAEGTPVVAASPDGAELLRVSARCIRNGGEPLIAKPLAERALQLDELSLGRQSAVVADDLHTLAQILRDIGEPENARPLIERAVAIHEASYGPDHRTVGYDLALLALTLRDTNDPLSAKPLIERAMDIDIAQHGQDHGYVADDMTTLARILHDLGDLARARELTERAITIDERLYGRSHTYVGVDLTILARILKDLHDEKGSRPIAARALEILESRTGYDYRWTSEDRETLRKLNGLVASDRHG